MYTTDRTVMATVKLASSACAARVARRPVARLGVGPESGNIWAWADAFLPSKSAAPSTPKIHNTRAPSQSDPSGAVAVCVNFLAGERLPSLWRIDGVSRARGPRCSGNSIRVYVGPGAVSTASRRSNFRKFRR